VPDIHIEREHSLGLPRARELAFRWAQTAESRLSMACSYEEGMTSDLISFRRAGVHGELRVTKDRFELHARLGFLLGAFKDRIQSEITRNLDELLRQDDPVQAFEQGLSAATAKKAGKAAAKPAAKTRKA
jgi:putative polyhydroxyalkanoate system protein